MAERCPLCGDEFHRDPDTEDWLGLTCPGTDAEETVQQAYRSALAEKFAEYWEAEVRAFFAWEEGRPERNAAWDARQRADGATKEQLPVAARPSVALQPDCDARTASELNRQHRDEVFAPYGGFDVDINHLTVPGQVPQRPPLVRLRRDKATAEDALLYLSPEEDR